jgi:hypothetical protein
MASTPRSHIHKGVFMEVTVNVPFDSDEHYKRFKIFCQEKSLSVRQGIKSLIDEKINHFLRHEFFSCPVCGKKYSVAFDPKDYTRPDDGKFYFLMVQGEGKCNRFRDRHFFTLWLNKNPYDESNRKGTISMEQIGLLNAAENIKYINPLLKGIYEDLVRGTNDLITNEDNYEKRCFYKNYLRGLKYNFDHEIPEPTNDSGNIAYLGYRLGHDCSERVNLEDAFNQLVSKGVILDVLICNSCGWPSVRDPNNRTVDCGNPTCSNHRAYICQQLKLICPPSEHKEKNHLTRLPNSLPTLAEGDIGEIVSVTEDYYIGTDSNFVYKVRWQKCADPLNNGKESTVESNDMIGLV